MLFEVDRLFRRFGCIAALSDLLGLIGPNGAGKSTLFECLGGRSPLRGEIIQQFDLRRLLHQPLGTLSKGQRAAPFLALADVRFGRTTSGRLLLHHLPELPSLWLILEVDLTISAHLEPAPISEIR